MLSARIEQDDYDKFDKLVRYSMGLKVQDVLNLFVVELISGSIMISGSHIITGDGHMTY